MAPGVDVIKTFLPHFTLCKKARVFLLKKIFCIAQKELTAYMMHQYVLELPQIDKVENMVLKKHSSLFLQDH